MGLCPAAVCAADQLLRHQKSCKTFYFIECFGFKFPSSLLPYPCTSSRCNYKLKSILKCHFLQDIAGILAKENEIKTEKPACLINYVIRPWKKACRTVKKLSRKWASQNSLKLSTVDHLNFSPVCIDSEHVQTWV